MIMNYQPLVLAIDPIMVMGVSAVTAPITSLMTILINRGIQKKQAENQTKQLESQTEIQKDQNIINWTTQDNIRLRADVKERDADLKELHDVVITLEEEVRKGKELLLEQKLQILEYERQQSNNMRREA